MAVNDSINSLAYWAAMDKLVAESDTVIDRPKGTAHPRYPAMIYPFDYGYLQGTNSGDGNEIDCWVGSLPERIITGVIFIVDLVKRDMEGKILIACTPEEMQTILTFQNGGLMSAILLTREIEQEC